MAQQQTNISIAAPGFGGINTEIAPVEQQPAFANIADQAIIDRFGRIAARKGFNPVTTNGTAYGGNAVEAVHEFLAQDGTTVFFSTGNNLILKGSGIPADDTPVGATITADDWQIINFDDDVIFFQQGHDPIIYDHATTTTAVNSGGVAMPKAHCALAAYGRVWCANTDTDNHQTVYWCTLSDITDWNTAGAGDAGTINIQDFWPTGYDEIQALAAHNGKLIIFGRNNIVVYTGADGDPAANLTLSDTVANIGCIARDTVAVVGTDVLFLDATGVRSLNRTIQEQSLPIGDVSKNIRRDLINALDNETDSSKCKAVYSPENNFYLLILHDATTGYCFNTKLIDQDGSMRVTTWTGISARCGFARDGVVYFGDTASVITKYDGYDDLGSSYRLRYYTQPLSFGDSTKLKIPKQIDLTLLTSASGEVTVYWAYDYAETFSSGVIDLAGQATVAEYNIAEYNIGEFSGGIVLTRERRNVTGNGVVVQVGVEVDINGSSFSLQEMNIQALLGRQM